MRFELQYLKGWILTAIYCVSISLVGFSFGENIQGQDDSNAIVYALNEVKSDQQYLPAASHLNSLFESIDLGDRLPENKHFSAVAILDANNQYAVQFINYHADILKNRIHFTRADLIFPQHYFW
ncbi:hypothetical protein DNU06_04520 [Putridiphycobacter roseus]|uniref:Uncharacterized protein n=1 Tax=Putridiphycobacter roseus TaxID=2219161 RepID=A0A2W1NT64_9FLAO|nr:hypothetical protein [Putridiphycobacter roseus]PZE17888.1 hypothetical protein DNU06_04520 [Putridiphycobacter roseus]